MESPERRGEPRPRNPRSNKPTVSKVPRDKAAFLQLGELDYTASVESGAHSTIAREALPHLTRIQTLLREGVGNSPLDYGFIGYAFINSALSMFPLIYKLKPTAQKASVPGTAFLFPNIWLRTIVYFTASIVLTNYPLNAGSSLGALNAFADNPQLQKIFRPLGDTIYQLKLLIKNPQDRNRLIHLLKRVRQLEALATSQDQTGREHPNTLNYSKMLYEFFIELVVCLGWAYRTGRAFLDMGLDSDEPDNFLINSAVLGAYSFLFSTGTRKTVREICGYAGLTRFEHWAFDPKLSEEQVKARWGILYLKHLRMSVVQTVQDNVVREVNEAKLPKDKTAPYTYADPYIEEIALLAQKKNPSIEDARRLEELIAEIYKRIPNKDALHAATFEALRLQPREEATGWGAFFGYLKDKFKNRTFVAGLVASNLAVFIYGYYTDMLGYHIKKYGMDRAFPQSLFDFWPFFSAVAFALFDLNNLVAWMGDALWTWGWHKDRSKIDEMYVKRWLMFKHFSKAFTLLGISILTFSWISSNALIDNNEGGIDDIAILNGFCPIFDAEWECHIKEGFLYNPNTCTQPNAGIASRLFNGLVIPFTILMTMGFNNAFTADALKGFMQVFGLSPLSDQRKRKDYQVIVLFEKYIKYILGKATAVKNGEVTGYGDEIFMLNLFAIIKEAQDAFPEGASAKDKCEASDKALTEYFGRDYENFLKDGKGYTQLIIDLDHKMQDTVWLKRVANLIGRAEDVQTILKEQYEKDQAKATDAETAGLLGGQQPSWGAKIAGLFGGLFNSRTPSESGPHGYGTLGQQGTVAGNSFGGAPG